MSARTSDEGASIYALGMEMTASALRRDIDRILDRVIETGEPVIVERNGRLVRISAEDVPSRLDALVRRRDIVVGDSSDFVHVDWSSGWSPAPSA